MIALLAVGAAGAAAFMAVPAGATDFTAASATVDKHVTYWGDPGTVFTFSVTNTGTQPLTAVTISPGVGTVIACTGGLAGWTATVSSGSCSFANGAGAAIAPAQTVGFQVTLRTGAGSGVVSTAWQVSVMSNVSAPKSTPTPVAASAGPGGLSLTVASLEITDVIVATSPSTVGGACPPHNTIAPPATAITMVVCVRNHGSVPLTVIGGSLGGTFILTPGAFSGGTVNPGTAAVVIGNFTGVGVAQGGGSHTVTVSLSAKTPLASATFAGYTTNQPPVSVNDSYGVLEDHVLSVPAATGVLANDTDPDHDPLTAGSLTQPANGTVVLNADGSFTYTPHANFNGTDTFTYRANDGFANSASPGTVTINVTSVNDAPQGTAKTVTTLEDAPYTFAAADFGFSDPNDSPANNFSAVIMTTVPTTGSLTDNGAAVSAGDTVPIADITGNKLVFTPVANANGSPYASFTFRVMDDGGTANGGVDTDPTARTMTINVTSVNDAPQGTAKTVTTLEDAPYTFAAADFGFSDPNDSPANNFSGVVMTTVPSAGTLADNGTTVSAGDTVPIADITANKLVFTPVANANGSPYASFTFQVKDDGGTANGGVDTDPTARTMTINVTSVNDAPIGTANTVTTLEDTAYTFAAADFGFSDPNDSPANNFSAVIMTTVPTTGSLADNGTPVSAGDSVPIADITANKLVFTPVANANGSPYASFTFQVMDDGGTANSGVDTDPTARAMTINVTSVNDAPVGTANTITTLEDSPYTFAAADFGFSDPNDSPADNFSAVVMTTVPSTGTLADNGTTVSAGDTVPIADITGNKLVFTPAANANGSPYASFTFQVQDDGGTANGGVDTDPTARAMTINVTSVNDAPIGTANTVTTLEDTPLVFGATDFGFTDPNDSPADNFNGVVITTVPSPGSLTDNGTAVSAGDTVSIADITGNKLVFTPAANASGSPYASFTFQVQDDGGTANGGVDTDPTARTMTINVTSVNDAPQGADNSVTMLEDTPYTFTGADFGFSDPDDSPADNFAGVVITTLPTAGTLTDNGSSLSAGDTVPIADITGDKLVFTPDADANGTPYASFTFQVQDDGGTANGGADTDPTARTMTINVTAVNDAPSFTKGPDVTVSQNSGAHTVAGWATAISAGPPDEVATQTLDFVVSNDTNGQFTVQPAIDAASGDLTFTLAAGTVPSGGVTVNVTAHLHDDGGTANSGVNVSPDQTFTIKVVQDQPPTVDNLPYSTNEDTAKVVTMQASDPDGDATTFSIVTGPTHGSLGSIGSPICSPPGSVPKTCTADVTYTPDANYHGPDSFTYKATDPALLDSSPGTISITVNSVNDAPAGADNTVTTAEDTPYTFTAADFGFTDPNDSPADNFAGAVITAAPGAGTLADDGTPVSNGDFVPAADITANKLVFTPVANANGTPYTAFTFEVRDDGGGTAPNVDTDPSAKTMTINVTSVNDAPIGSNSSVTTLEDIPFTFHGTDFPFTDPNDSPANTFAGVVITSLPTNGSLTNDGTAVAVGDFVTTADLGADHLVFTPVANANGSPYTTFGFKVRDDGGTANGGVDTDTTARTMTVNVTSVNDPPAGTDNAKTTLEDTPITFATADFGFSDPNDSPANNFAGVVITTKPADGTLADNGTALNDGDFVTAADITGNKLVFTPAANGNGAPYTSFTFQVRDDGGGATNTDPSANTMTINVTAVNDPPIAADQTATAQANMQVHITGLLDGASDANDPENASPVFKVHDVTVHAGSCTGCVAGDITNLDADAGSFDWIPPAGGTGDFVLDYRIDDNGLPLPAATSAAAKITITVNGPVIWFVDSTAPSGGNGRWTGTNSQAFQTVAAAAAVDAANHRIFVINNSPSTIDYSDGIALNSGEWLIGQGATNSPTNTFDALMGITPPTGLVTRPTIGGVAPTLQNTVTLNTNARVQGLVIDSTTNTAMNDPAGAITGVTVSQTDLATTTGTALNIDQVTGGLSFGSVTHSGGSGAGVSITNSGSSSTFNFGAVTISSGSSAGFTATSGGTVNVTGTTNTIATTTGVALKVDGTTIGASGLKFQSISAGTAGSGPTNGIFLNNTGTSGGLTVTGTGSTGTGGTIQKSSNSGIQATSTKDLNLSWMTIQNNGDAVNEGGVRMTDVTGTGAITSSTVSGSAEDNIYLRNDTSTALTSFTIHGTNCSITNNSSTTGNNGINVLAATSANMTVTVDGCALSGNRAVAIGADSADSSTLNVTIKNNTITQGSPNHGNQGIQVSDATNGNVTFDVESNKVGTSDGTTPSALLSTGINIFNGTAGDAVMAGKVINNTVLNDPTTASGTSNGFGIRVFNSNLAQIRAKVTGNTVKNVNTDYGILAESSGATAGPVLPHGRLDVEISGNTVDVNAGALDAIRAQARNFNTVCAKIATNTTDAGGAGFFGIFVRQANSAIFDLDGWNGVGTPEAFVLSQNPSASTTGSAGTITGVAAGTCNFTGVP